MVQLSWQTQGADDQFSPILAKYSARKTIMQFINFIYQGFLCNAAFKTSLPLAALMMIFEQLRKRHMPQRDDQAASSVLPINC